MTPPARFRYSFDATVEAVYQHRPLLRTTMRDGTAEPEWGEPRWRIVVAGLAFDIGIEACPIPKGTPVTLSITTKEPLS